MQQMQYNEPNCRYFKKKLDITSRTPFSAGIQNFQSLAAPSFQNRGSVPEISMENESGGHAKSMKYQKSMTTKE